MTTTATTTIPTTGVPRDSGAWEATRPHLGPATWSEPPGLSGEEHRDPHFGAPRSLLATTSTGATERLATSQTSWSTMRRGKLRYLVVQTANWWIQGKKVLVAPRWASSVSWIDREVHVDLTREAIKSSPEWDPGAAIDREYESQLYGYYGRPVYWDHDGFPDRAWYSAPVDNRRSL